MQNYTVFKQVFDALVHKQLPRCRALLKIGQELVRLSLPNQKDLVEASLKAADEGALPQANVLNLGRCHEQVLQKIEGLLLQV